MRASRAGRTGRSWYGSYEVRYQDAAGGITTYWTTNRRAGERACRKLVAEGAVWAELRADNAPAPTPLYRVVANDGK